MTNPVGGSFLGVPELLSLRGGSGGGGGFSNGAGAGCSGGGGGGRVDAALSEAAFANVRAALDEARGEQVLVVRQGWRAQVLVLTSVDADWTDNLLAGANLSASLERVGESFDFANWLGRAVQGRWLKGVALLHD